MTNIFALRQRKIDLRKSAQAINDEAKAAGRDLTAAEEQNYAKIVKAIEANEAQLVAEEKRLAEAAGMDCGLDENGAFAALARGDNPEQDPLRRKKFGRIGCKSWADVFGMPPRGTAGFQSIESFLHSVRFSRQQFDPRLQMATTMNESSPSDGGFLVPEQYAATILQQALESSIIMPRCQIWPMASASLRVPGIRDVDHSAGSLFGNVVENWYDELETIDLASLKTYLITLTAKKLALLSSASSELTEDGVSFESVLTAKLQAAAEYFLDRSFLFGDGASRPQGMLDSSNPALVVASKFSGTPNGDLYYEDVLNMYKCMAPNCRSRSIWVFSAELVPNVYKLQNRVFNLAGSEVVGGSAVGVFVPDGNGGGTLLGRPVIFSEKMKGAGQQGDAAFLCPPEYAVGVRRQMTLARSDTAGFATDSIFWKLTIRCDGQSTWEDTLTTETGLEVSPFVVLAKRHA